MNAVVKVSNRKRGVFAAQTEGGEFIVFELVGPHEPELEDVLYHSNFLSFGSQQYKNLTQGLIIPVIVQDIVAGIERARKKCFI